MDDAIAGCTHIPNFPAETHVDRSIVNAGDFVQTDVKGTRVLREAARNAAVHRYLQVSTDEVYSDVEAPHRSTEANPLPSPRTVLSLQSRPRPHGPGPACDLRPSPDHYPKLIRLFVTNALEGLPLPFYRDGQQLRDWLYVEDHRSGIATRLERGTPSEIYNTGAENERPYVEVVDRILQYTKCDRTLIRHVPDLPGHDRRYALDTRELRALG